MKFDKLTCPKCGASIVTVYGFVTAELNEDQGELIQSSFYWDDESDCRCNSCGHEDRAREFEPLVAMAPR